jgi:azurin
MRTRAILTIAMAVTLFGCPKSEGDKPAPTASAAPSVTAPPVTTPSAAPSAAPALAPAELKITATGTTMVFDVTKFYVKTGQQVHVVFENKAPGTLPHNWVLLKAGKEASYAASVVSNVDAGYYSDAPEVLAHIPLVTPGNKAETTFTAPSEPGDYPYICSFPGHYMMMKGVIIVKAP